MATRWNRAQPRTLFQAFLFSLCVLGALAAGLGVSTWTLTAATQPLLAGIEHRRDAGACTKRGAVGGSAVRPAAVVPNGGYSGSPHSAGR